MNNNINNQKDCVFCDNKIDYHSSVCNDCVKQKCFISSYEMRKYRLIPSEIKQFTSYYLRNKIEDDYNYKHKYYYGYHYLKEDVDNFLKTNIKYIQRIQIEDAKKTIEEKKIADKKEEEEYFKNQREIFLIAVFKKAGYFGSVYKYYDNYIIADYLNSGDTYGKNISEFEKYIFDLVKYNLNNKNTSINKLNNDQIITQKQKDRVDMITSIINLSHDTLSSNNIYMQYVKYGIEYINNDDNEIQNMDDLIIYLINYFDK
jgi:hypothetical protein